MAWSIPGRPERAFVPFKSQPRPVANRKCKLDKEQDRRSRPEGMEIESGNKVGIDYGTKITIEHVIGIAIRKRHRDQNRGSEIGTRK
ncbi:hypothetical protein EVAR_103747_1 [Eumeta japonica]|uniref:Uncharacterized protein n=1 Tax=Eumeta variegata TaxID=151549 RepID=A0A4C1ZMN0_EUMVA|nr:hypothetical protein EVAR_103747_1 [Eumeta japonica]